MSETEIRLTEDDDLTAIGYVNKKLYVGMFERLAVVAAAKPKTVAKLADGCGAIVGSPNGKSIVFSHGKKVVALDSTSLKKTGEWSVPGEGATSMAFSPGGDVVLVVASNEGGAFRAFAPGEKKPRFSGAGIRYALVAWLDAERFASACVHGTSSYFTIHGSKGKELSHFGSLPRIEALASHAGSVYAGTAKGLLRLDLDERPLDKPAKSEEVWSGAKVNAITPIEEGFALATEGGVFLVGVGAKRSSKQVGERPAALVATTAKKLAYVHRTTRADRSIESHLFEVTL
ncbi:MAG: hypothetical protein JST00_35260 [Deltaproteobacteria bacterium]|nr:hypothetical protein [Deltaproteobacteria bacterium]